MILREMPDLPPRPATDANAHFRRWFYERWGRENALVCGRTRHAEYVAHTQTLSVKAAWGGAERYVLPAREVAVDDDNVLILNEGVRYGSVVRGQRPTWSCAVFFGPGLLDAVLAQRGAALGAALDGHEATRRGWRFSEHLRPDAAAVHTRLTALCRRAVDGESSQDWLDEQCLLLLDEMLALEPPLATPQREAPRRAHRLELQRRLRLAADHIETEHARPLTLAQMAAVACLSPYHFVRRFGAAYGLTPHAYLCAKRARVAARLLAQGHDDADHVAALAGFGSRSAMRRALKAYGGRAPTQRAISAR